MPAKSVSTRQVIEKECKNSIRYSTKDKSGEKVLLTVYVLKDALEQLGNPKEIEVTIAAVKQKTQRNRQL